MKLENFYFLTSNPKKSTDFKSRGFEVKNFDREIKEVLSPSVEEVVLYKSKEADMKNVIVEDTCLHIEGAPFMGTQIKDYWPSIEFDTSYHNRKALWEVSVCLSMEDKYVIATGKTQGVLQYPGFENAYHFEKIFSIEKKEGIVPYGALNGEDMSFYSPRIRAIEKLKFALENEDFTQVVVIEKKNVPEWTALYQEPEPEKKKLTSRI